MSYRVMKELHQYHFNSVEKKCSEQTKMQYCNVKRLSMKLARATMVYELQTAV